MGNQTNLSHNRSLFIKEHFVMLNLFQHDKNNVIKTHEIKALFFT